MGIQQILGGSVEELLFIGHDFKRKILLGNVAERDNDQHGKRPGHVIVQMQLFDEQFQEDVVHAQTDGH
jgi:hypothetical protein